MDSLFLTERSRQNRFVRKRLARLHDFRRIHNVHVQIEYTNSKFRISIITTYVGNKYLISYVFKSLKMINIFSKLINKYQKQKVHRCVLCVWVYLIIHLMDYVNLFLLRSRLLRYSIAKPYFFKFIKRINTFFLWNHGSYVFTFSPPWLTRFIADVQYFSRYRLG